MASPVAIIPAESQSIFSVINALTNPQDYQAIVRPNNPPNGIAGYIFDIVGEESMEMVSDITDHYLEDNTSIQDQISLKPEKITIKGMVAELVMTTPTQAVQAPTVNTLPLIDGMQPDFTNSQIVLQTTALANADAQPNSVAESQSLFNYFNGSLGSQANSRQSKAFSYFYQLWKGRQLFSVETPWGIMNDMAIETLSPSQGEDSKSRTDFSITFKKLRFAQSVTVNIGNLAGRAASQQSPTTQQSKATTTTASPAQASTFLYQMTH
jgi:hypothetical protein